MKAPPKEREMRYPISGSCPVTSLNESLHLKVQNKRSHSHLEGILICLIESPSKKGREMTVHKLSAGDGYKPQRKPFRKGREMRAR